MIALLLIGVLVFVIGCQKKVSDEPEGENEPMIERLKEMLIQSNSPFQDAIKFSSKGQLANGSNSFSGQWDFSKSVKKNSENYVSLSIPLKFTSEKHFLFESSISGAAENEVTFPFLLYITPTTGKAPFAFIVLKTTSLPLSKSERKGIVPENLLVREVFYDLKGKLIYDTDKKRGSRTFFTLSEIPTRTDISLNALQCSTTETKEFQCSSNGGYNSTCTYITRRLMRCSQIPNNGDPFDPYNFLDFLEESDNMGGGTGELVIEEIEFQNQQIIDSLNGFPCAQGILAELPSCNTLITDVMRKIFSPETDELDTLRFRVDLKLNKDSLLSGYFESDATLNKYWYRGTIYLNPWELQNSTKEFILSTMIHEVMHSIIGYDYTRVRAGVMSQDSFKQKYPIFWNTNLTPSNEELAEHEEFASKYRNEFVKVLKQFNANISTDMAEALAWSGLHKTSLWKSRSDTTAILEKIHIARQDTNQTHYSTYNLTKCN